MNLSGELGGAYESVELCNTSSEGHGECLRAEPGLDLLMRNSKDPQERLSAWTALRDALGPPLKNKFGELIQVENQAARAAGRCSHESLSLVTNALLENSIIMVGHHWWPTILRDLHDVMINERLISGYNDVGECWREELETPWLTKVVEDLYEQVAPLYRLLHAFVRHRLGQFYGQREIPLDGPIPAHILGMLSKVGMLCCSFSIIMNARGTLGNHII